jgi:3-dehydroquinate dehydratase-1
MTSVFWEQQPCATDKICVSLGGIPFARCLKLASVFPLAEIRLDLLDLDPEKIESLAMPCRQWVATCRPGKLTDCERAVLLSAAIRSQAAYVDIEYESDPVYRCQLIELARKNRSRVIISYHNFDLTPDVPVMNRIVKQAIRMGADLVKMAVTANSPADCAKIMSLYGKHNNIIAFAMGDLGKITRIAAPFLGAEFTFASVDEAHLTAPGQLTASQMETVFHILEKTGMDFE